MSRAFSPHLLLRLLPLFALLAFAAFIGAGAATEKAEASGPTVGVGSCTGASACTGNTGHIGANSCNGIDACDDNAGTIGDNSCNAGNACRLNGSTVGSGTIGDGSCNGSSACFTNGGSGTGAVGDGSCNGSSACVLSGFEGTAAVGAGSCNGAFACDQIGRLGSGTVGDGSCNGDLACFRNGRAGNGTVGVASCNGAAACAGNGGSNGNGTVGDGSCNGTDACATNGFDGSGMVGDNSCNGGLACYQSGLSGNGTVGVGSCNGASQCPQATTNAPPGVGDCAENLPANVPALCVKPIVTATLIDESTGLPYVPGTWTRGPVVVMFACTSFLSTIPRGAAHNDTAPSGAGNTYPAVVRLTKTTALALSSRWRCMDANGAVADPPAGFPAAIKIDRRAPTCTVTLSRASVPRVGTPTLVTATVNGADADSGVASKRIVAISPAPLSGDALPDASPGTWTLVGAFGKTFTFTGEVRDNAGNVATCTKKVVSR